MTSAIPTSIGSGTDIMATLTIVQTVRERDLLPTVWTSDSVGDCKRYSDRRKGFRFSPKSLHWRAKELSADYAICWRA